MSESTHPTNPLLQPWDTPHGLPPFDRIAPEHFGPAFEVAMQQHRDELDAIASQSQAPTFENTVAAFDRTGRLLGRIESVFYNLTASHTSPALQAVQRDMAVPLAAHNNAVTNGCSTSMQPSTSSATTAMRVTCSILTSTRHLLSACAGSIMRAACGQTGYRADRIAGAESP